MPTHRRAEELAHDAFLLAHSSSSQLSRAKKMLQNSLAQYWLLWLLPLLLPVVLTGASHEDGSLGECKILLAGYVYNSLDCLQKVLLPFLALGLCRLGALF